MRIRPVRCSAPPLLHWLAAVALILVAGAAAYSNSLQGPFVFDDLGAIVENRIVRRLWPPQGFVVSGRPVVVYSWAVNYAMGGLNTLPYHATNLSIHLLAALTLFGIVRRTLALPGIPARLGRNALPLGLATALVWAVHPLQTQAVTYVVQRFESLMGLFSLLALYCLIRGGTSGRARAWGAACAAAVLLAMGCKEVAVSAPVVLLLYDRAFLAGSVREAWVRRTGLYGGLLGVWAAFALLQWLAVDRSAWSGYGLAHSWQGYALSQFGVILHYLRLSVWPQPLVLDYGWPVARSAGEILPGALVVGGLGVASGWALVRRAKLGFLGAWFFLILAPSSSVLPLADLAFEHRMYLPLAAIVVGGVLGGEAVLEAAAARGWLGRRGQVAAGVAAVATVVVAMAAATWDRNRDYASAVSIWRDTVAKAPGNARAFNNLGVAYIALKDAGKATRSLKEAVRLRPDYPDALNNLGLAYRMQGNTEEAVGYFEAAVAHQPGFPWALNNLGLAYRELGDTGKAIEHFEAALRAKPDYADALNNLGLTYGELGKTESAIACFQAVLRLEPGDASALHNLGAAYLKLGDPRAAIGYLEDAVRRNPESPGALNTLAVAHVRVGDTERAIECLQAAIRLRPDDADAFSNLGAAHAQAGRLQKAVGYLQEAVRLDPTAPGGLHNLGLVLIKLGRRDEALAVWRSLRELDPARAEDLRSQVPNGDE